MLTDRSNLPKARTQNLIVKELPDETLVYDSEFDKAHCLNSTAALVWKYCDGETEIEALAAVLKREVGATVDEAMIWLALDQLESFKLLQSRPVKPAAFSGLSRRQLVRHIGAAALALPVIMSIAVPTAAQSASACACATPNCRPAGCPCANPGDCINPLSCSPPPKVCT